MKNVYEPFGGTNMISFGESRDQIREKLCNHSFLEIKRNEFAENTVDYYENIGCFIEYSSDNICEAIEFIEGAYLIIQGEKIFQKSYSGLRQKYDAKSKLLEEEEGIGVTYHDLGFGITKKLDTDGIETVIIFSKGYW